jgi:hypothetical protein
LARGGGLVVGKDICKKQKTDVSLEGFVGFVVLIRLAPKEDIESHDPDQRHEARD